MSEIHGLQALLTLRKNGRRPAGSVMLTLTDCPSYAKFVREYSDTEGVIRSTENVETLDLRPLVGMSVIVCADTFGPRENRLFVRLQEYAVDVVLYVTEWVQQGGTEFGLSWRKGSEPEQFPRAA
jgi:hypothetical protein